MFSQVNKRLLLLGHNCNLPLLQRGRRRKTEELKKTLSSYFITSKLITSDTDKRSVDDMHELVRDLFHTSIHKVLNIEGDFTYFTEVGNRCWPIEC